MKVTFREIECVKRYPLAISRGVVASTTNLFVTVEIDGVTGIGEMCPGRLTGAGTAREGREMLERLIDSRVDGLSIHEIWRRGCQMAVAPCAMAALDVALWDRLAKASGRPLYELLGLSRASVATSVTVGIERPAVIRQRVAEMLDRTGAKFLKVKLGSSAGRAADRAMFEAAREAGEPFGVGLRVDANGGWTLEEARGMLTWLADRGVEYVEQPLAEGAEDQLAELRGVGAMPIYVDESCRFSANVPGLAELVDGVNVKLMKCGGLTEAMRIVAAARACGLKTMIGCMSESSVSILAGASIGAMFDHVDLDSHLNLSPDPAGGALLVDGVVLPRDVPGHGGYLRDA